LLVHGDTGYRFLVHAGAVEVDAGCMLVLVRVVMLHAAMMMCDGG